MSTSGRFTSEGPMRRSSLLASLGSILASGTTLSAARAAELITVHIGYSKVASDAPLWIADKLGYFAAEGLQSDLFLAQSSEQMMPLLSSGQLDFASSAAGASLYNGVLHGADVRAVADTGSDPPGYGWAQFLVRTEHVKSGRFKTLRDMKGMTICGAARASSSAPQLAHLIAKAGLKFTDVKREVLPYTQHQVALENGAIDASLTVEPFATFAVEAGAAVKIAANDQFYPNQQISVLIASGQIVRQKRDVGARFMRAWLRANRYYNDAFEHGHMSGPNADAVVKIMAMETGAPEALFRRTVPIPMDPNGKLNLVSMRDDLAFYKAQGFIEGDISVEAVVDLSLAADVAHQLGAYIPHR
jgi:NitT/TauT family transport system substrate-binding protein